MNAMDHPNDIIVYDAFRLFLNESLNETDLSDTSDTHDLFDNSTTDIFSTQTTTLLLTTEQTFTTAVRTQPTTPLLVPDDLVYSGIMIAIGVAGLLANAIILMLAHYKRLRLKTGIGNILILNQAALDLYACLFLVLTYAVKTQSFYFTGSVGLTLCQLFDGQMMVRVGTFGSVANLVIVSGERYAKIVQPLQHRKHAQRWMLYVCLAVPWLYGFIAAVPVELAVTTVENGLCQRTIWVNRAVVQPIYGVWTFVITYALPLALFVYFYGNILLALTRRYRTSRKIQVGVQMSPRNRPPAEVVGPATIRYVKRSQLRSIRSLVFVVAFFVLSWTPFSVYYLLSNLLVLDASAMDTSTRDIVTFIAFLNICVDPFLYAVKHESVTNVAVQNKSIDLG